MKNVVVVGGGLSGLAAAVSLSGKGYPVTLLEQSSRPGGRAYSFREAKTESIIDNGQHLLLSCYTETISYLQRIGSLNRVRMEDTLELTLAEASREPKTFRIKALNPSRLNYIKAILRFGMLSLRDKISLLYAGHLLFNRTERILGEATDLTVDEWLTRMKQTERTRMIFWNPLAIAIMNESPAIASAVVFVRAIQLAVFSDLGPACIVTPLHGLSEVFVTPAIEYLQNNGASIQMQSQVVSLEKKGGRVTAAVLKSGEIIKADAFILAVLPDQFEELVEDPGSPDPLLKEYTPIITVDVWFKEPVSLPPRTGLIGTAFHWVFRKDEEFSGKRGGEYLSFVMSGAREYVSQSSEELLACALIDLRLVFPELNKLTVSNFKVIKEKRATVSLRPETESKRPGVRTLFRNVFLAGDWTDTKLPATIEGAVYSGFKAAGEVMRLGGESVGDGVMG
jgi:hydroxysqualene dehydroxylase